MPWKPSSLLSRPARRSSTRPLKFTSSWVLTPVTLTSRSVVQSFCPTAPARPAAFWFSLRTLRSTRLRLLALTMLAAWSWSRRSPRRTGSSSTWSSLPPTWWVSLAVWVRFWAPRVWCPPPRLAPWPPTSALLLRKSRLVRSSTVWTRPTSSTAPSARFPSALRSCRRTWTLWSRLLSRLSPQLPRVSISVPAPSLPPWAPASRSPLPSICNLIRFTPTGFVLWVFFIWHYPLTWL